MSWLQSVDADLFRFLNLQLRNPVLDAIMPQFSSNSWFIPAVLVLAAIICRNGGARARLFILMLGVVIVLGDSLVINTLKHAISRPRPHQVIPEAIVLVGKGGSGSMPSSHTSSWCAAAFIAFVYYPWTWRLMLPLAGIVGFSRIYLGVHYPSDVIAGALLGAGYAAACLWLFSYAWQTVGQRCFPVWWSRLPCLVPKPGLPPAPRKTEDHLPAPADPSVAHLQWMRLGYATIVVLFIARLIYIASDTIQLSEDEAYQWLWSKHLALSYFSKPPMIALLQFCGTSLWGDTVFGVRFFSVLISAVLSGLVLRFFAREANARVAFFLILVLTCTPLLSAGSVLMTIDPPLVLFWTAAMFAGWRALQPNGSTRDWLWVGICGGLCFLSKYSALFLIACFSFYFFLSPPARAHLRRPGPWLALLIFGLCLLPVLIWNAQNGWATLHHVADNAKLDEPWQLSWRVLSTFLDFTGQEFGLLNPVFFVAMLAAVVKFWPRRRESPLLLYLFCLGAPVFFGYWLYSFHSRVHANWIAPAVVPLLALMTLYWEQRWREGLRTVKGWALAGLVIGFTAVILFHDTDLAQRLVRARIPANFDPLRRVRAIDTIARSVGRAFRQLEAEGTETFIIASHYGMTGQLTFYLPEARVGLPSRPLVYVRRTAHPKNQFFFWPEYHYTETRRGQNAIFVKTLKLGEPTGKVPADLQASFEAVTDLGFRDIRYGRRIFHRVQLFACRHLR